MTFNPLMSRERVIVSKRGTLSKADKVKIWNAQNGICPRCLKPVAIEGLGVEYDHDVPRELSNDDGLGNLFAMHSDCHREKTLGDDRPRITKAHRQEKLTRPKVVKNSRDDLQKPDVESLVERLIEAAKPDPSSSIAMMPTASQQLAWEAASALTHLQQEVERLNKQISEDDEELESVADIEAYAEELGASRSPPVTAQTSLATSGSEGSAPELLAALEKEARRQWGERQADCAHFGANIPMPTIEVPVDILAQMCRCSLTLPVWSDLLTVAERVDLMWSAISDPRSGDQQNYEAFEECARMARNALNAVLRVSIAKALTPSPQDQSEGEGA
jgi:hypothetical protein